ncbi:hypothetical protein BDV93DRAFT_610583 [Ceratobasidium sp. AG-I]|nr:hypothetical protein BDV93DRAFT_610583 [Ceratobasidium sp. AG-I]
MSQAQLPVVVPDVLVFIAQELQSCPFALLQLCVIDKATFRFLRPILYQNVLLISPESIKTFCSTIISDQESSTRDNVISLSIGTRDLRCILQPSRMHKSLAPNLRTALRLMPNLEELNLSATSNALAMTLNGLNPPFKLRRLSYSGNSSTPVIRFLMNQPLITKLEMLTPPYHRECLKLRKVMFQKTSYLPRLEHLSGYINIVPHLASLRPVRAVVIADRTYGQPEYDVDYLGESTTPIVSIRFVSHFHYWRSWRSWREVVERLKSANLCATLKAIQFEKSYLETKFLSDKPPGMYIASFLAGFEVLETFELSSTSPDGPNRADVILWLDDMLDLSSWTSIVPSLQRVVMYGVPLE